MRSSSNIQNLTEEFFGRLEAALGRSDPQSRDVLAEVRTGFRAQVEALQREGMPEDEAVDRVLDEMGPPEVLAAEMRSALPPLSSGAVAGIRYLLAGGLALWTLLLMWMFRAWEYGFGMGMPMVLVLHLPVILLLWPKIIWRKNWLFGVVPAAILVVGAFVLVMTGTTEHTGGIAMEGDGLVPPTEVGSADVDDGLRWQVVALMAALATALVVLLALIQQRRQRLVITAVVLIPLLVVEGAFQWEEHVFRGYRDRFAELMEDKDSLPAEGTLQELGIGDRGRFALYDGGREFKIWWSRPLKSSSGLVYSSQDGEVRAHD